MRNLKLLNFILSTSLQREILRHSNRTYSNVLWRKYVGTIITSNSNFPLICTYCRSNCVVSQAFVDEFPTV